MQRQRQRNSNGFNQCYVGHVERNGSSNASELGRMRFMSLVLGNDLNWLQHGRKMGTPLVANAFNTGIRAHIVEEEFCEMENL